MNNLVEAEKTMSKELIVVLLQDGELELDWDINYEQLNKGHEKLDINSKEMDKNQQQFQDDFYTNFTDNPDKALFKLGFLEVKIQLSESISYISYLAKTFVNRLSREADIEFLREKTIIELEESLAHELLGRGPFINGIENLNFEWLEKFWNKLNKIFSEEIKIYSGTVESYFAKLNQQIHLVGRVFFHLVESKKEDYPFAFLATYSSQVSAEGKSKHLPLKNAILEYGKDSKKLLELLSTVNKVSGRSVFISDLVESGEIFHPIGLSTSEGYTFLKEITVYEEAGILCRIPNWWKNKSDALKLTVSMGNEKTSGIDMKALVSFDATISLGGETISKEELKKLLAEAEGLAFIKGKWIEVNHEKLKETLKAYELAHKLMEEEDMSIIEALRFQLNSEKLLKLENKDVELEVTNGEWLNSVIKKLTKPDEIEKIGWGEDFRANLRPYQAGGVNWLNFMKKLGLGACLADDMGLGKTVQVIALLNFIREGGRGKNLLVVPASLIGNWISEIEKFAPSLKYCVLHPSENKDFDKVDENNLGEYDIFISTYGMLLKLKWLETIKWDAFILDEAQAIKNPGTKQTKGAKAIKASFKIAMTGTPIENRLSDLWSLFDFLNKGLLGSAKEFTDFTRYIKERVDGYEKLKKVVGPFILRRLKTDKSIISDLPDKIEMKTYTSLSKKQVALYTDLVNQLKEKLENEGDGIGRKGLVLASLMKFKQICNHPSQYLGQNLFEEVDSGKFDRLREICETIYEKRERVLVFTQFKEMTGPIAEFLEKVFSHKGLLLHGETIVKKRQEIVGKFQGHEYVPFLVLSIKAGGVGLNLTKANHVIHFDRWWNPAVENQATDRAFRIGQNKNVIVHKFITRGTIEEKIDLMIEAKTSLAKEIISDVQENWITEMNNKELLDLFRLTI